MRLRTTIIISFLFVTANAFTTLTQKVVAQRMIQRGTRTQRHTRIVDVRTILLQSKNEDTELSSILDILAKPVPLLANVQTGYLLILPLIFVFTSALQGAITTVLFALLVLIARRLLRDDDEPPLAPSEAIRKSGINSDYDDVDLADPVNYADTAAIALAILGAALVTPNDNSEFDWLDSIGGVVTNPISLVAVISLLAGVYVLSTGVEGIAQDTKLTPDQRLKEMWDEEFRQEEGRKKK